MWIEDAQATFDADVVKYKADISEASGEAAKAKAEIALSKAEAKAAPEKEERDQRLAEAAATYKKVKDQVDKDAADAAEAKELADGASAVRDKCAETDTAVKADEAARVSAKAEADAKRAKETKEGRAARKEQAKKAGKLWAVDLKVVASNADAAVPYAARENVMEGIEGVQASIEENRAVMSGKKSSNSADASVPSMNLDPNAVPSSWTQPLQMDSKYETGTKSKI